MEPVIVQNMLQFPVKNKKTIWLKRILFICAAILLLNLVAELALGEGIAWFGGIILPVLFLIQGIRMSGMRERYVPMELHIYFEKGGVRLVYPRIDRQDGKGECREIYMYAAEDTEVLEYNEKMDAMRIKGIAELKKEYTDGKMDVMIRKERRMNYNFVIFLNNEQRRIVLDGMQKSMSRVISYVS